MKKKVVHIVKHAGGWAVKKSGALKASRVFPKQQAAIVTGHEKAKKEKTQFVIHGRNGKIRKSSSFGNDPYPPKDKT